jgi:tetratricopeptide (TPR) repeat protein
MHQERKWKELITQFGGETFAAWPTETALEALQLRGQIYSFTKDGSRAEADLQTALKLAPPQVDALLLLADNYVNNLNDDPKAIAAYQEVIAITGTNSGWQPLTATVSLAKLYTDALEFDSAHAVLKPYGDLSQLACSWRVRLLRAFGHLYAAQGKEPESLAKFREALSLETSR